jgi:hypothetical protein
MSSAHHMGKAHASRSARVRPGQMAMLTKVDDPEVFAVHNKFGAALTISFNFDTTTHVMTVVIEGSQPGQRLPGEEDTRTASQSTGDLPV